MPEVRRFQRTVRRAGYNGSRVHAIRCLVTSTLVSLEIAGVRVPGTGWVIYGAGMLGWILTGAVVGRG